ncbi:MAG TPA: TRAP transporter TatT component family protein [Candidatus Deferrimicrobiaceae bacterium]
MKRALAVSLGCLLVAAIAGVSHAGDDLRKTAEALWAARENPAKAAEAVSACEALLKEAPNDYDTLLRLSRLHYWIGQNLEAKSESEAMAHYVKGRDYGRRAAAAAADRAGGYFFEAANLGRENVLKGKVKSLLGIGKVEDLNRKAEAIQPDYFYRGPDRFFCAYYTRLPGLLGGSLSRAIDHGRKAVEAFPNYAGNRFLLAEAYVKDGRNELARAELEAALAAPDDAHPDAIPEQRLEKKRAAELLKKIGK